MRNPHRSLTAALTLLAAVPLSLTAQAPVQPPQPGPEHEKLGYFAGRWTSAGEMRAGPFGPGGTMTATGTCEWFPGGFYLVCRSAGTGPSGPMHSLGILGYSAERKRYTYYGVDNSGMPAEPGYGVLAGDTWTWEGEATIGGKMVKSRYVMTLGSADSYTWRWEMSMDGGPWTLAGTGTETRAK